jgi:hypothetical protein
MRTAACTVALLALVLAGCGGDDKDSSSGSTAAATTTAPPETVATTTTTAASTTTTAAGATTETTADESKREDPITVRGRTGDTLTLIGQYSTAADGSPKRREKIKVTLLGKRGPFSGFNLAKGHKLIGFDVRISNVGEIRFSDPLPGGTLILVGGENGKPTSLIPGSGTNPCPNPSLKLKPGQSKKVCMAFDVPASAKPQTLQYAVDSGYGDTALWRLR